MAKPIVITDRVYIPVKHVDEYELKARFLKSIYNEDKCGPCPYRPDRHSEVCDTCPGFLGQFKLYNEKTVKGVDYYGMSIGNRKDIKAVMRYDGKPKVIDKRVEPKFRFKVKFVGDLHDYQQEPCNNLLDKKYGILDAPPRSGKTVMLTYVLCKMGLKTLILANQYDYLTQFYETICGSDTQKPLTNVPDIEGFEGKKICGIVEKFSDFDKYDICLATYQQFISEKGKQRLNEVKKKFGLVMVDEVDLAPAHHFSKVVNAFHAKHRIGCTGTTTRKDCIVAGTLVVKEDGTKVPVEEIRAGDLIIGFNELESRKLSVLVSETHVRPKSDIYEVVHSKGTLRCTGDHLLWCVNRQAYVPVKDLTADDSLLL